MGLEDVPDAKEEVVVVYGAYRSSHVLEGLEYFAKYRIYLVAYTVGGDSPQSNAIYAGKLGFGFAFHTKLIGSM